MKKQSQCPECSSFKVANISPRHLARTIGLTSLVLGLAFTIFLIGIPFVFVGIILLLVSFFLPQNGRRRCKNCGHLWEEAV